MRSTLFTFLLIVFYCYCIHAQSYTDYIGAGQSDGVIVTSSDANEETNAIINGSGLDHDLQAKARFLTRATLGYTIEDLMEISDQSIDSWIDQQFSIPMTNYTEKVEDVRSLWYNTCVTNYSEDSCRVLFMNQTAMFKAAWWDTAMKGDDQLRQRVAMALSEIIVISDQSLLGQFPQGMAYFYDILYRESFGNYEELLKAVTTNMAMGFYLSHLNNPKSNPELNTEPDENYAREFMQLFTIGLYELNNDGSRKVDAQGLWIPTYDNNDIKGLAKVFTGLSGSEWSNGRPNRLQFGRPFRQYSFTAPMVMYDDFHETGEKIIIGDYTIPAGQSGMQDVEEAIQHIFNHPNVGPFICHQLIQRLVKSNPSPGYVDRVASVFNDNGQGVRGDMKSVIEAILTDNEAYECYWIPDYFNGMLRSPMLRYTQMMIALKAEAESDIFHNDGIVYQIQTGQNILSSPTVFNFYRPDYEPNADFALYEMEGPEFQIYNSSTSSNYVNFMLGVFMQQYWNRQGIGGRLPAVLNGNRLNPYAIDKAPYRASLTDNTWLSLGYSPAQLVDYLDILLANGALSDDTKSRIVNSLEEATFFRETEAAQYAAFLVMIDPDFTILK